jgi:membrane protein DedA with SNARE-associated domain
VKFASGPVLFAVVWGGGFVAVAVVVGLTFPVEDLLLVLFPASLLWLFLPFVFLYLWRRSRRQEL